MEPHEVTQGFVLFQIIFRYLVMHNKHRLIQVYGSTPEL